MRYIAAYLLLQIGGKAAPTAEDIKSVLGSVGIDADEERLSKLLSELNGKDVAELISEGSAKFASVPSGGAAASSAPAAAAGGAAEAPKEEEKKEEEKVRISSSSFDISRFCAHYFFTFTGGIRRRHGLRSLRLNALKPPLPFPIPITHPVIVRDMMAPSYCYRVVLKSCVISLLMTCTCTKSISYIN